MSSRYVLDGSAAVGLLLGEPSTGDVESVLEQAVKGRATLYVPALFPFEVGNALLMAERRKRIDAGSAHGLLSALLKLPLTVEPPPDALTCDQILQRCRKHALTFYDASYAELAERRKATLLTLDAKLKAAT